MKSLMLMLSLCCATAQAQTVTLDYSGALMTGTETLLTPGNATQSVVPITGAYSAQITLQGNALVAYSAMFVANDGTALPMNDSFGGGFVSTGVPGPVWTGPTGNSIVASTDSTGTVTGAAFAFDIANYNWGWMGVNLGAGQDALSFLNDHGPYGGTCDATAAGPMLCSVTAKAAGVGSWSTVPIAAPELDFQQSMEVGLLLAGGLAVIRGRGRRRDL